MRTRNVPAMGVFLLIVALGVAGAWFYYFGGKPPAAVRVAPVESAPGPVAVAVPAVPATPPKPAEPPAPPKPKGPWDQAGVSQAVWEYNRAFEKEIAGWEHDKSRDTGVAGFLRDVAIFSDEELATMERITGIKFNDPKLSSRRINGRPIMTVKDWLTAVAAANKLPGTLEDWNSEPCRKVRDPQHNLGIAITGVWPQVANLVAAGYTGLTGKDGRTVSADAGFRAICEFATQQDGFR